MGRKLCFDTKLNNRLTGRVFWSVRTEILKSEKNVAETPGQSCDRNIEAFGSD